MFNIRNKLIKFRQNLGFTQKSIAELLGVSRTYINYIELGKAEGSISFWKTLQNKLCLPDEMVWQFMKEGVLIEEAKKAS